MPIIIKIIFGVPMIVCLIKPKLFWKIIEGWKYHSAELTEECLLIGRIISGIALVIVLFA